MNENLPYKSSGYDWPCVDERYSGETNFLARAFRQQKTHNWHNFHCNLQSFNTPLYTYCDRHDAQAITAGCIFTNHPYYIESRNISLQVGGVSFTH